MATNIQGQRAVLQQSVYDIVKEGYGLDTSINRILGKGKVDFSNVNRLYGKIPIETVPGIGMSKTSSNGTDELPMGNSPDFIDYFFGFYESTYAVKFTKEQYDTLRKPSAVVNVVQRTIAKVPEIVSAAENSVFHTSGDALLTSAVGASATGTQSVPGYGTNRVTYTFTDVNDPIGIRLLWYGMPVDVFASDLTTRKNDVPTTVIGINYFTNTITLSIDGASYVSGQSATTADVLAFPGMVAPTANIPSGYSGGATPPLSGHNQFSPSGGGDGSAYYDETNFPFNAAGITGDAFRHGFPYATNPNGTLYFGTILRNAQPQLLPSALNASTGGGSSVTETMVLNLIQQMQQKRPAMKATQWEAVCPQEQFTAWFKLGQMQSSRMMVYNDSGAALHTADLGPKNAEYSDTFTMVNIKAHKDNMLRYDQIHFLVPENIGRCTPAGGEFGRHTIGDAFEGAMPIIGDSGTPKNAYNEYWSNRYDWFYLDPGAFGILYNLSRS